jgi:hypothetical protein
MKHSVRVCVSCCGAGGLRASGRRGAPPLPLAQVCGPEGQQPTAQVGAPGRLDGFAGDRGRLGWWLAGGVGPADPALLAGRVKASSCRPRLCLGSLSARRSGCCPRCAALGTLPQAVRAGPQRQDGHQPAG